MKTLISPSVTALIAASILAGPALADPPVKHTSERKQKEQEVTVFVTGSLIPQRVKLRRVGTNTVSPVRVIDRNALLISNHREQRSRAERSRYRVVLDAADTGGVFSGDA